MGRRGPSRRPAADGKKLILLTSAHGCQGLPSLARCWRIETSYRQIKQDVLGSGLTLRSGTPQMVYQEIWGAMLAYNLVRLEMAEVAAEGQVRPTQLSFTTALHYLRHEWGWMAIEVPGKIPAHLLRLRNRLGDLLLQQKRGRIGPGLVKKPPKRYHSKSSRPLSEPH